MDRPERKIIRLNGYDYSRNGVYFVTICTKDRMCIFWENNGVFKPVTDDAPTLSQIIKNLKENVTREIGFSVWQKSFHDRILRNQHEYTAACRYIARNPDEWENDELYIKE